MFGIKKWKIFQYSPWANGMVEQSNRNINMAFRLEEMKRDIMNIRSLVKNVMDDKQMRIVIKSAEMVHNHTPRKDLCGYSPLQISLVAQSPFLLDVTLKMQRHHQVQKEKYIVPSLNGKNKIDYEAYYCEINKIRKAILKSIKTMQFAELNEKQIKQELERIEALPIVIGDFVSFRGPYNGKKSVPDQYGWIVQSIEISSKGKKIYRIKNMRTGEVNRCSKGHILRRLTPIRSGTSLLNTDISKILAEVESKLIRLEEDDHCE
eukprot:740552_1